MSIITFDKGPAGVGSAAAAPAATRKGFWARIFDRIVEARERQALALIQRHGVKLPQELEEAGWKVNERSEDSLPFAR
jgi:hypothetical protein